MKIIILGAILVAGALLVGLQHQQIGRLRAENSSLAKSAAEANQLRADLEKSAGMKTQDASEEIDRLRAENRDLLRLRGEANQLLDARAEYQRVSAENERLRAQVQNAAKPDSKAMTPIVIRMDSLSDHGHGTPEATMQTFLWAEREGNMDELSRCFVPESWAAIYSSIPEERRKNFLDQMRGQMDQLVSIEIVARKDLNSTTVQLGMESMPRTGSTGAKISLTLTLRDGEWKLLGL